MRKTIKCARDEYEDIVKEIEGDLNDLHWRGAVIQIPAFSEVVSNFHWYLQHCMHVDRTGFRLVFICLFVFMALYLSGHISVFQCSSSTNKIC